MAKKERRRQQLDASLRFLLFAVFSSALFTRASSLRSRRRRLAEGGGKSARALEKGAPQRRSSFEKECEKTSELFPSFRVFFLSLSLVFFFKIKRHHRRKGKTLSPLALSFPLPPLGASLLILCRSAQDIATSSPSQGRSRKPPGRQ
jgi:hypothetical protein